MDDFQEEWKPIQGYEGLYEVSNFGRVKGFRYGRMWIPKGRALKPRVYRNRRLSVGLCKGDSQKLCLIHSLVANAFIGPRPNGYDINHIDGNCQNNYVGNLEYVTRSRNLLHAFDIGLKAWGEDHCNAKLMNEQVRQIRKLVGTMRDGEIAALFGINRMTVNQIKHNKIYKRVI